MIRNYLVAICMVGAIGGTATAEELDAEISTSAQSAPIPGKAVAQAASCLPTEPCSLSPADAKARSAEDAKARVAMALLFMGIKNNCGQRPCALRLVTSR